RVAHYGASAALAAECDIRLHHIDDLNVVAVVDVDSPQRQTAGREAVRRALDSEEVSAAIGGDDWIHWIDRTADLGGELPHVRRGDAGEGSASAVFERAVINRYVIRLIGGEHAQMRINHRGIARDYHREGIEWCTSDCPRLRTSQSQIQCV